MKPTLYVESVGIAAPGLPDWPRSIAALAGAAPYQPQPLEAYSPTLLPPNERRRVTQVVRLAFRSSEDALARSSIPAAALATVFASSEGDTDVVHRINVALAQSARSLSPTDFHNSVHNAPAGYWSIAVGSKQPSTSLAAFDGTFAAALNEAAALALGDGLDVLATTYDMAMAPALVSKRPIPEPFASALVLTRQRTARSIAALSLAETQEPLTMLDDPALEALRRCNPSARALPLLQLLARRASGTVHLPAGASSLSVTVAA